MRTIAKMLVTVVCLSGIGMGAVGQNAEINLNANRIVLEATGSSSSIIHILSPRALSLNSSSSPGQMTYVYGNLTVSGGSSGSSSGHLFSNTHIMSGWARVMGDLQVFGQKQFVHTHPTDASKLIRYAAMESSQSLTITRGTAKTVNGQATINLPEHFSLVTSKDEPITVILTPEGAPVLLYTKQKSKEKIVVAMKPSDFSEYKDVEFAFQVTGVRDGFEKQPVIVDVDKLNEPTPAREDVQKRIDAYAERIKAEQELKRKEAGIE